MGNLLRINSLYITRLNSTTQNSIKIHSFTEEGNAISKDLKIMDTFYGIFKEAGLISMHLCEILTVQINKTNHLNRLTVRPNLEPIYKGRVK